MAKKAMQGQVTTAFAEKDPDAVLLLPATVSDQDASAAGLFFKEDEELRPGSGGAPGSSPCSSARAPTPRPWQSSVLEEWRENSARAMATVIRSCLSHERSRRCRRRCAAPETCQQATQKKKGTLGIEGMLLLLVVGCWCCWLLVLLVVGCVLLVVVVVVVVGCWCCCCVVCCVLLCGVLCCVLCRSCLHVCGFCGSLLFCFFFSSCVLVFAFVFLLFFLVLLLLLLFSFLCCQVVQVYGSCFCFLFCLCLFLHVFAECFVFLLLVVFPCFGLVC